MTLPRDMCEVSCVKKVFTIHSEHWQRHNNHSSLHQVSQPSRNLVQAGSHGWKGAWRGVGVHGKAPLKCRRLLCWWLGNYSEAGPSWRHCLDSPNWGKSSFLSPPFSAPSVTTSLHCAAPALSSFCHCVECLFPLLSFHAPLHASIMKFYFAGEVASC